MMVVTVEGSEGVPEAPRAGEPGSCKSREQLLADLAEAAKPDLLPKALAVVALDGVGELVERLGGVRAEAVLAELADRLEQTVSSAGSCYRPRKDEFALLCDAGDPSLQPLLERAIAALREPGRPAPLNAAFGSVLVPDEASDPIAALRLADERLTAAQPGRAPRERRQQVRPGSERLRAGADGEAAAAEPLQAIHGELVKASTSALRIRRVDQLLDIAGTLTMLADAVRIDEGEPGRLQGQPRSPARMLLLLKELDVKLAALEALEGPVIEATVKLVQEPTPLASNMSAKVLTALDEIAAALTAA